MFPFIKEELERSPFTKERPEKTPLPEGTVAFPSANGLRKSPFRKGGLRGILWLTLSILLASLLGLSVAPTARADSSSVTAQVCRANVEPCQRVISIPEGETVTLDLLLDGLDGSSPLQVAAWETHYQFTNTTSSPTLQ